MQKTVLMDHFFLAKKLYGQYLEPVCSAWGLTRTELDILLFLANNPQYTTATDIVVRRRLAKSHVSTSVHALERRGYLERSCCPENRRKVQLRLLPAADEAVRRGRAAQTDFFAQLYSGFSGQELEIFERLQDKIAENIRTALEREG